MVVLVVADITVVDVVTSYANKGPYLSCLLHHEGISWHSLSDAQQFFFIFQMAKKCTFFANICDIFGFGVCGPRRRIVFVVAYDEILKHVSSTFLSLNEKHV